MEKQQFIEKKLINTQVDLCKNKTGIILFFIKKLYEKAKTIHHPELFDFPTLFVALSLKTN